MTRINKWLNGVLGIAIAIILLDAFGISMPHFAGVVLNRSGVVAWILAKE